MGFLVRILVNALALFLISQFNFMGIHADSVTDTLIGALVLGLANAFVRPLLMVLSCPLVVLTLGLFTLIINGVIFYYVLKWLPGWHVPNFWAAFWAAIVTSLISWVISVIIKDVEMERRRT
ncbi:MAG: phage holin family protein [Candidatus Eremiobacteraeota bacterium]|jgi:putative membrane protein|nr:phage holin family protein [Candidatus Eremiobacteraeota bacterium]MBV8204264.1 phage holin family protein [Candidatus Eremiobacteraeota bacterium]MBV8264605.1 phage holin family protein [Candidatus Eremiobacteraeota bacterium]MBV8338489.1 phage holin family protein [Candidatus Eremiobacteraeota bacterium]MBV8459976.1 phage holin family protein [Candidatus Eremiobacteraeota bacterium]